MAKKTYVVDLHDEQLRIINERKRFNVICCGRRFGKSLLGISLAIEKAWQHREPVAWLSPTYPMLQNVWREFKEIGYELIQSANESQKRFELVGGGSLDFWSADNYDSIRGNKYARAIIDEGAICRNLEDAWQQAIRPTLTDYAGDAYFLSTPKGQNFFKELFDRNNEEWKSWQFPTSANPYILQSEIDSARLELPPNIFAQEYEAKFISSIGQVFKRAILTNEIPDGLRYYIGSDLAYSKTSSSDYSVVVVLGVDSLNKIYIIHVERWQSEIGATIERLKAIQNKYNVRISVEANGVQKAVADMVQNAGVWIQKFNPVNDKLTRSLPFAVEWNSGNVYVKNDSWTLDFCNEIENFSGNGKDHDDQVDAVVNAFQQTIRRGSITL
jgi:predicted phage terminase large subunit-like protein